MINTLFLEQELENGIKYREMRNKLGGGSVKGVQQPLQLENDMKRKICEIYENAS